MAESKANTTHAADKLPAVGFTEQLEPEALLGAATDTLKINDLGSWTQPAPGLYPHQWLWDSCFVAIGLRHIDIKRAQQELRSLLRGQWSNGMLPHIIFSDQGLHYAGRDAWHSERHKAAAKKVKTTAITQPPVLAEAVVRIGEILDTAARRRWYKEMYPALVAFHEWLYKERDPHNEGLVVLMHPWESGLDDTPPWMVALRKNRPWWGKAVSGAKISPWLENRFKVRGNVPLNERISIVDLLTVLHNWRELRRCGYDLQRVLHHSKVPLLVDVAFNAILVRANTHLQRIAEELGEMLPVDLQFSMQRSKGALRTLQDADGMFFPRDFRTRELLTEPSIETFLPLYSGVISQESADKLAAELQNPKTYWLKHPVASVPRTSKYFAANRYWQGPMWVNMNWFIIDGLRQYGHHKVADELLENTLRTVSAAGMYEYFSPIDGKGHGGAPFSWTAALVVDMLQGLAIQKVSRHAGE